MKVLPRQGHYRTLNCWCLIGGKVNGISSEGIILHLNRVVRQFFVELYLFLLPVLDRTCNPLLWLHSFFPSQVASTLISQIFITKQGMIRLRSIWVHVKIACVTAYLSEYVIFDLNLFFVWRITFHLSTIFKRLGIGKEKGIGIYFLCSVYAQTLP